MINVYYFLPSFIPRNHQLILPSTYLPSYLVMINVGRYNKYTKLILPIAADIIETEGANYHISEGSIKELISEHNGGTPN